MTFPFFSEKTVKTFDFLQNRYEIKKNLSMIRDICDIKYLRLLNFYNVAIFSTRDF